MSIYERAALDARILAVPKNPNAALKVYRVCGVDVGYFWIELRGKETAFLIDFYVFTELRGRGLGRLVFKIVTRFSYSLGAREVRLAVSTRNKVALSVFLKEGVVEVDNEIREGIIWIEGVKKLPCFR